jgi:hypothetical protein
MTVTETQKQNAIDAINDLCDSMLEYETKDAGDNYAHLVGESWCNQKTRDMAQSFNEEKRDHSVTDHFASDSYKPQWELLGIDKRWKDIEPDILADMALESFDMVPGSIWGPYDNDCIVLDSFVVGEIEVDLNGLNLLPDLWAVRESCDAYISGNDYAYISTDAAWYAVVNVQALNIEIEQYIDSMDS